MSSTKDYQPYSANAQGFTEVLIDFKKTLEDKSTQDIIGFQSIALENISQGQAVYCRASDGKVGLATCNSTLDLAIVAGFARTAKTTGQTLDVLISGIVSSSGLDAGNIYYLGASPGVVVSTPPSTSGQYLTRVGEANNSSQLIIRLEPPVLLV